MRGIYPRFEPTLDEWLAYARLAGLEEGNRP